MDPTVIPETGTRGQTSARGETFIGLNPRSQVPFARTVSYWLPRTLSHEVHHQVRILAGPGFGATLLEQLVTEGTADVFEGQAFSGPPNPWDRALTTQQEHALWGRVQPDLQKSNLYRTWMLGDPASGIPHWAGFTIGYHIASGYQDRHPGTTPESLALLSTHDIVTGSGYQQ